MGVQLPQQARGADFTDTIVFTESENDLSPENPTHRPHQLLEAIESSQSNTEVGLLTRFFRTRFGQWCRKGPRSLWLALTNERFRQHLNFRRAMFTTITFGMFSLPGGTHVSQASNGIPGAPHRPSKNHINEPLLESSSSGRYRVMNESDEEEEEKKPDKKEAVETTPQNSEPPLMEYTAPQVLMTVQPTTGLPPELMAMSSSKTSSIEVFAPPQPPTTTTNSETQRVTEIPHPSSSESEPPIAEETEPATETTDPSASIVLNSSFRGYNRPLLDTSRFHSLSSEDIQSSVWESPVSMSFYGRPHYSTEHSESWQFDPPPDQETPRPLDLHPEIELIVPPFPDQLSQLTFDEGEGQLPLEMAYEMAMRIATRSITEGRQLWKDLRRREKDQGHYERGPEPDTYREQVREGFRNLVAGSDFRVQIGLRKFVVKGGVEFNLPWDNGTLEFEGAIRGRYSENPVDRLTFKATWEQQMLGGELEVEGRVDYQPVAYDPLRYQVTVSFNRSLFNGAAHLNLGGRYRDSNSGPSEVSFTFGLVFNLERSRVPVESHTYIGEGRAARRFERRYRVSNLLRRLARKGQERYQDEVPLDEENLHMPN